jgi:hypothetical protein
MGNYIYLLTIKISSSSYLLWRSQVLPLLQSQHLFGYVDASITMPSSTDASISKNPELIERQQIDQLVLSLLHSSLIEEAHICCGLPRYNVFFILKLFFILQLLDEIESQFKLIC